MTKDLEVRHCRVLAAVHDHGGVGAAARVLGVAQSTVSEALLSLERLLGVPVTVRRAGREAILTAAAQALLPHARALIAVSEAALDANARQSEATIRLGTVESISSFLLPGPLSEFRMLWPQTEVRITIGLCEDLRQRMRRSELDAAISIERSDRPRDPQVAEVYWPARLCLIVAPDHPLVGRPVQPSELEGRTCLVTDHDGAFNVLVKTWMGSARAPRFESAGSVDGVKKGVLKSGAIGVLPDYAVSDELAAGALSALDLDEPLPSLSLCLTTLSMPPERSPLQSLTEKIDQAFGRTDISPV